MSDIELVIKIPNGAYNLLKTSGVDWLGAEHILNAVANGTPLPKGHGDLISRQAVLDLFGDIHPLDYSNRAYVSMIKELPSAGIKPIVYGEWIVEDDIHCSKCGYQIADFIPNPTDAIALILEHNYCPNCGAYMKEESEKEE